jgi:uncharacterized membrane protein
MPLDPFALAAAGAFTAGCDSIHALSHRAEHVTRVLAFLAFGLATAVGSLIIGRSRLVGPPDPVMDAWMLVAVAGV